MVSNPLLGVTWPVNWKISCLLHVHTSWIPISTWISIYIHSGIAFKALLARNSIIGVLRKKLFIINVRFYL